MRKFLICVSLTALSSCATVFRGDAHISKEGCVAFCQKNALEFSGMVALGEYSTGCICSVPHTSTKTQTTTNIGSGVGAAAVGVVTQMRAQQQAAAQGGAAPRF